MMMQLLFMIQQTLLYKMAFQYGGEMHGTLMAAVSPTRSTVRPSAAVKVA